MAALAPEARQFPSGFVTLMTEVPHLGRKLRAIAADAGLLQDSFENAVVLNVARAAEQTRALAHKRRVRLMAREASMVTMPSLRKSSMLARIKRFQSVVLILAPEAARDSQVVPALAGFERRPAKAGTTYGAK